VLVGSQNFPGWALLPGLLLVGLAAVAWPRPAPLPRYTERLTRAAAPALHDLVDQVARAIGAPAPRVALDDGFGADGGGYGVLGRRYLIIGVPLWMALDAQQRVALVAHQLAHFVDGDPRRGPLVSRVDNALLALTGLLLPGRGATRIRDDPTMMLAGGGMEGGMATRAAARCATPGRPGQGRGRGLAADRRADDRRRCRPVAGPPAAERAARGVDVRRPPAARAARRDTRAPAGVLATVTLDEATNARIDAELGSWYQRANRTLIQS
jgi:hypothetical protein